MLVLSRKTGEWTVIAGNIRVVVLTVQKNRVKLGFEGPAEVPIHREEVLERIVDETRGSAPAGKHAGQHVHKQPGPDSDVSASPHPVAGAVPPGQ